VLSELRLISSGCRNAATAAICTTLSVADAVASVGRSIHIALRQVPARETSGDLLSLDSKLHIEHSLFRQLMTWGTNTGVAGDSGGFRCRSRQEIF